MRTSLKKGCAGVLFVGLAGVGLLVGWAVAGTLQLDGLPASAPPLVLSTTPGGFSLTVTPLEAPIDQPIAVRLTGLEPGEEVVLRASADDAQGIEFSSWARFAADAAGTLDLERAAPLEGTYEGIDSSGLLWSMSAGDAAPFVTSASWSERIGSCFPVAPVWPPFGSRWMTPPGPEQAHPG